MSSVVPRMALIDSLNEAHDASNSTKSFNEAKDEKSSDHKRNNLLGLSLNQTDINYILRISRLILRQNALSTDEDIKVVNVYSMPTNILPETMLDSATYEAGKYLITKYIASFELFGYKKCDIPDVVTIEGPKELLKKLKVTKGVTIRRTGTKQESLIKSERYVKESKRKKTVTRQHKIVDSLSSEMNACQAFMNSDCSKPKVQKSTGIQKALLDEIKHSLFIINKTSSEHNADLKDFLLLGQTAVPSSLFSAATHATVEFAGVKFKTRSVDGKLYLEYVEKSIINKILNIAPSLQRLVVCDEKYTFTPETLKLQQDPKDRRNKPIQFHI
ncbi:unnamed protein product [Mytilus coruscus]|uniref:Uncharacterized protein n=1 Tax=Mytilus coruscus TaxID=42192 RepID=A0A6J8A5N8_MYTCO|nr:unnamed protein product [Mytilus coruscus]